MKKNRLISTVIAGTLAAAIVVGGGTFAYLKDSTSTVQNKFNNNYVDVEIKETGADSTTLIKNYNILPGTTADKDPTVTYKSSVGSYVFVKVTDTVNTKGQKDVVNYSIVTDWTELTGDNLGLAANEKLYVREMGAVDTENGIDLPILKDNKVTYTQSYSNNAGTAEKGNLTFQAFAIQKVSGDSTDFTPAEAWAQLIHA